MSVDKARKSPLSELINECPGIFEDHYESDYFKLTLYMMMEWGKKEESFYYPYLNQVDNPFSIIQWTDEELLELHDGILK
jgi:hypothetical protein